MSAAPLLELAGVGKRFTTPAGSLRVLDGVDLRVAEGESIAVTGPSGSGKSTLLAVLAGLEPPSEGSVRFRGERVTGWDEDRRALWRRRSIGFVFQNFRLIESLTALENVALPLEILGEPADRAAARAQELLAEIGMAERAGHFPSRLSGGEQQRVAIARAYAHRPEIVFADEPTGNLDQDTAAKVLDLLTAFQAGRNAALVLGTHDVSAARRMSRRVALDRGRLLDESRG